MAYVVCQPCDNCKYTDCVVVCPVNCFYEDTAILWINPNECIDCDACRPECPVEAIFPAADVPEQWQEYIELNASKTADGSLPNISAKQDPLGPPV